MVMNSVQTLFFDYDGVIHNSLKIYAPAFRKACSHLVSIGLAQPRVWSDAEISPWIGMNSQEMWERSRPDLPETIRQQSSAIISAEMQVLIEGGHAELYPGALETLSYLRDKGYHLLIVSNCRIQYRNSHWRFFKLDRFFEKMVCSEEYGFVSKGEILNRIRYLYPLEHMMIGDRQIDIDAGRANDMRTIACRYGFAQPGELDDADMFIDDIRELKKHL